jgi:hypothetical protein
MIDYETLVKLWKQYDDGIIGLMELRTRMLVLALESD